MGLISKRRNEAPVFLLFGAMVALAIGLVPLAPARGQTTARMGAQQPAPPPVRVALPGSVLDVTSRATLLHRLEPQRALNVIVSLNFAHPDQAQAYADAVSDPKSPFYRQFLTPAEIGDRFGPAQADYDAVVASLKANGLTVTGTPVNRMTIAVTGTTPQIEAAFGVKMNVYRESELDRFHRAGRNAPPLTFYSNDRPVQLPASIAPSVMGVVGLEDYIHGYPKVRRSARRNLNGPFDPAPIRVAYDTEPLYAAATPIQGQNRTMAIVSLEYTYASDILLYITRNTLPTPAGGAGSNVSFVNVNGGATSSKGASGEANLDSQMTIGMAPLATILIYDANGNSNFETNYLAVVTQIVTDNRADIATDSWGFTPTSTEYTQFNTQHQMMTMQGITYLNASGDYGSDLAANGLYPETDPEVLAVGGTVLTTTNAGVYSSETGWDGSAGGYDSSVPFTRPAYQSGRGVPTTPNLRLVPDVALNAAGPNEGGAYNFYFNGRLEKGDLGTSFASPTTAGCLTLVEQYLIANGYLQANSAGNYRLGRLNDVIYAQNGRNDVWHDITVGTSDSSSSFPNGFSCTPFWDFVTGWGSFDFYNFAVSLSAPLAVTVTPHNPTINAGTTLPLTATVTGSAVTTVTWALTSGVGSVNASTGLYTAPASVTSPMTAVVTATSTINTATPVSGSTTITVDPATVSVAGTITLTGSVNSAQPLTFQLQSTTNLSSITTMNATLTSTGAGAATGTYTLTGVTPGTYNLAIVGNRWLKAVVSNVNAATAVSGVNATLIPGDMNGDNIIDLKDFNILSSEYGQSGSNLAGDLNCDGVVDLKDFNLFSTYYGKSGQSLP